MSRSEQDRFADAVEKMMENRSGPETSEYFRVAGIHGWPGSPSGLPYCAHGDEHFPAWHRAYLREFERALQAADRDLGRGGNIALPYWDWTDVDRREVFPDIIRRRFPALPNDFLRPENQRSGPGAALMRGLRVPSDSRLRQSLRPSRRMGPAEQASIALLEEEHFRFAHRSARGNNIETPHDTVHVMLGSPMSSLAIAAFHPIFWLHHCNIDRFLSKYLELEPDSQREFQQHQRQERLADSRNPDVYIAPLEPFALGRRPFRVADTFRTEPLGYRFDRLPPTPGRQMREVPTLVAFPVDVMKLGQHSYMVNVFVMPKADAESWAPPEDPEEWMDDPAFADQVGIFGSKSPDCEGCQRRPVFNAYADITAHVNDLGISRHEVGVRVMCVDELGQTVPIEETQIGEPQVVGPYFEKQDAHLAKAEEADGQTAGEVKQLQTYLKRFGWLKEEVDGVFGDVTEAALKRFQKFMGLTDDGVAGPLTKGKILQTRMDTVEDQEEDDDVPNYGRGEEVKYWVGPEPGYLDRSTVLGELRGAFEAWEEVTGVAFAEVDEQEEADLSVTWGNRSPDNLFQLDGPGGALAHTTKEYLQFDSSERWMCQGEAAAPGRFYLFPVALHEVGHVLGLTHSNNPADVMAPYYVPDKVQLQPGDIERAVNMMA